MEREIAAQPEVLAAVAPVLAATAPVLGRDGDVWIAGCGDGLFAAETVARFGREAGYRVRPVSAAALLWDWSPAPGDVCVALSVSGGTARTVEAVAAARAAGARTLALTVAAESALARAADETLALPYTPITRATPHSLDHAVMLAALAALLGADADLLASSARIVAAADLAFAEAATQAAAAIPADGRFFFIGCGSALGTAGYGAAKLHEAGGLVAMAQEGENVAHGANFVMRPGDHAVLLGDGGPGDRRTRGLRPGLERLGLTVSEAGFDRDPFAAMFETALWCQRLCLAVAEARGLDVTRPGGDGPAAAVQRDWFAWT
jgi:fructoselysine-6-P-deglycase FrlB-like protein